jgi:hypothetical protein
MACYAAFKIRSACAYRCSVQFRLPRSMSERYGAEIPISRARLRRLMPADLRAARTRFATSAWSMDVTGTVMVGIFRFTILRVSHVCLCMSTIFLDSFFVPCFTRAMTTNKTAIRYAVGDVFQINEKNGRRLHRPCATREIINREVLLLVLVALGGETCDDPVRARLRLRDQPDEVLGRELREVVE